MAVRLQELEVPPQTLQADDPRLFVDRMEEWRRALGWSHDRFARHLGISRNYWWLLRTYQRELSMGVAQRVLRERPEFIHYLGAAVLKRNWGHNQEATPEGA
jgi:hypothetical protein